MGPLEGAIRGREPPGEMVSADKTYLVLASSGSPWSMMSRIQRPLTGMNYRNQEKAPTPGGWEHHGAGARSSAARVVL